MTAAQAACEPVEYGELNTANALLGDQEALARAWDRDGYWFFRDVLDHAAIDRLRGAYLAELDRQGVVDPDDADARYNGKPFDAAAFRANLNASGAWREFVSHPRIDAFFRELLGEAPHWVPNVVPRGTPPTGAKDAGRFAFLHQDGVFNPGIPFYVTWVPLSTITPEVGGLVLAEGLHHRGSYHPWRNGIMDGIALSSIEPGRWRRTEYRAGDLLMMDVMTPHTGLSNISDRFRFSIDLRVMRASGQTPFMGTLVAADSGSVTVRDETGDHVLTLDDDTYLRGMDGKKIARADMNHAFPVGSTVLVGRNRNHATVVRPPS